MMDNSDDKQIREENREAADLVEDRAEPVGDIDPPEQREAPKEEPKEPEKPKQVSKFQDKRAEIAAKARANREKADEENPVDAIDDAEERKRFGKGVETRADREARRREERGEVEETTTEPAERAVEAPASRMKLNVHGRELDLPQDEVIALAQKAAAAENILDSAKQARAEQMQILEELKQAKANQSPAEQKASEPAQADEQANQPDDSELDDIIDRIQVGSPEDAKKALAKYGENIVTRVMERIGNLDEHIEQTIQVREENSQRRREMTDTLTKFAKENPDIDMQRRSTQNAIAEESMDVMRENMRKIGVRDDTVEQLKQQHGFNDVQATAYAYRYLRGQGHDLPDNETVLRTSADRLRNAWGVRKQTEQRQEEPRVSEERRERTRNLGPQPRRANAAPTSDVKEKTREESRLSAVRQMRAYRRGR